LGPAIVVADVWNEDAEDRRSAKEEEEEEAAVDATRERPATARRWRSKGRWRPGAAM
jgi:hypothetical protein